MIDTMQGNDCEPAVNSQTRSMRTPRFLCLLIEPASQGHIFLAARAQMIAAEDEDPTGQVEDIPRHFGFQASKSYEHKPHCL